MVTDSLRKSLDLKTPAPRVPDSFLAINQSINQSIDGPQNSPFSKSMSGKGQHKVCERTLQSSNILRTKGKRCTWIWVGRREQEALSGFNTNKIKLTYSLSSQNPSGIKSNIPILGSNYKDSGRHYACPYFIRRDDKKPQMRKRGGIQVHSKTSTNWNLHSFLHGNPLNGKGKGDVNSATGTSPRQCGGGGNLLQI